MSLSESKNGQFVYRDCLFVEVGEGKRHPRASTAELKELLLPGKKANPPKDQVGHWYEAQLIHYGLPRSKDKNTAKVRLTNALSSGALIVPAGVQQIESDLKKEYASVQRRAKLAAGKEKAVNTEASSTSKKRKVDALEGASSTKISVKVGDVVVEIDQQSLLAAESVKKQKSVGVKASTKAAPKQKVIKQPKSTKTATSQNKKLPADKPKAASRAKIKHKVGGVACYGPEATGDNQWKCEPCKRQSLASFMSSSPKPPSQMIPNSGASKASKLKQTAKKSMPFPSSVSQSPRDQSQSLRDPTPMSICSSDESQEEAPPPYSENDYSGNRSTQSPNRVVTISGIYSIQLSGHLGSTELMLRVSHSRDQIWGRFTIGDKMGLLRLDGVDDIASSTRKSLGWRTEDCETGRLKFGKGCNGWIEFGGDGSVRGTFYTVDNEKDVDFDGQLEEAFDWETTEEREFEVEELSNAWHGFPHRAYGSGR